MKHAVLIAVLLGGFLFLLNGNLLYGPYGYDEADYMYAASHGLIANAFDSPTLSLPAFARLGMNARKDPNHRSELSEVIRGAGDLVFYRHWHGPLYNDWLVAVSPFASSEKALRAMNIAFPIGAALLMYFGALWILGGAAGQLAAILSSALYLWTYHAVRANELAPHQMFALWITLCLLCLARLMQTGERRYWYAAIVVAALAFSTLEIAFALIATVVICGHLVRDRLNPNLDLAWRSLAAFVITILIVWPGAILKLSFVKAYAFMAYIALFQKNSWGSNISVAGAWWMRMAFSPVPWILLAAAIYWIAARRVKWSLVLAPFVVFFVSMCLAIFRVNADAPRYTLPILPGLVLFGGWTTAMWLAKYRPQIQAAVVALILAAMLLTTRYAIQQQTYHPDPHAYALVDLLRNQQLRDQALLVPHDYLPQIHYYFPRTRLLAYRDPAEIPAALQSGQFAAVVYVNPPRYEPVK